MKVDRVVTCREHLVTAGNAGPNPEDPDYLTPALAGSGVGAMPGLRSRVSGIDACLRQAMGIPGAIGASVVDYSTGLSLGSAGRAPTNDPEACATGAAGVLHAATVGAPFASARPDDPVEDVIITTGAGYHLLRLIPTVFDSRLLLYVWLDRDDGNLAVARRRVRMLADDLVAA